MSAVAALARTELLVQWRRGTVAASGAVIAAYVLILAVVPDHLGRILVPYLVFSDPAALGFFFMGGTVLAQRAEGVTRAVAVTPVSAWQVLTAQVIVLGGIGTVAAIAIAAGSFRAIRWGLFLFAATATAAAYASLGYAVAMRSHTVNQYFARATAVAVPFFLPLVAFVTYPESPWLAAWPTTASLSLLRYSTRPELPVPTVFLAVAVTVLVAACALTGWWAHRELVQARREGRA